MAAPVDTTLLSLDEIEDAAERLRPHAIVTPTLASTSFSQMCGREVHLKAEILQRTGSFKFRGAYNVISRLDADVRARGVVAASAGNHAQGVALAARIEGVRAVVYMPETAPITKVEATRGYGAEVRLVGTTVGDAVEAALRYAEETGAFFVHPYDDRNIMAGQGTLGLELLEQVPEIGTVLVPLGGGGLISGVAAAVKLRRPDARIVGIETEVANSYVLSRRAGRPVAATPGPTIADGIAVFVPSELAFAHIETFVDDLVTVDDDVTAHAVTLLLERSKFLVEASGAVGIAALLSARLGDLPEPIVAVLSGGNIDPLLLDHVIRHGLEQAGRFAWYRIRIPDSPGQLVKLLQTIAELGGNVVTVEHRREGIGLPFGFTEVAIAVETRGVEHAERLRAALSSHEVPVEPERRAFGGSSSPDPAGEPQADSSGG